MLVFGFLSHLTVPRSASAAATEARNTASPRHKKAQDLRQIRGVLIGLPGWRIDLALPRDWLGRKPHSASGANFQLWWRFW
jgi:hypothetical protein